MHIYIYDTFVNNNKYKNTLARIETRITDLGLNGKIIRLGAMNSIYETVEREIKNGAKTITAVGDDNLLNQTINAVAKLSSIISLSKNIPIGYIPVGKNNTIIAECLGIDQEESACDTLSARRIQKLDLGLTNDYYFLTQALIPTQGTKIEIDKNYSIEITETGDIYIINLPTIKLPEKIKPNIDDGVLELFIKTKQGGSILPIRNKGNNQSVISFKHLKIINPKYPVIIDGSIKIPTPVEISIAKEKVNLIIGKNRKF